MRKQRSLSARVPTSAARAGVTTAGGTRKRKIKTRVGEIELSVPRLRTLAFQTMIFERYRRMEISLEEAFVEMYLLGISTRKVTDVTEALCDFTLSPTAQSRLNKKVYVSTTALIVTFSTR